MTWRKAVQAVTIGLVLAGMALVPAPGTSAEDPGPEPAAGFVYSYGSGKALGRGDWEERKGPAHVDALPEMATAVAAGYFHSLVVGESGNVYAFGSNVCGQLGLGDREDRHLPVRIDGLPDQARAVAVGYEHSLVVLENGDVYSFGCNDAGVLGHGDRQDRDLPARIEGLPGPAVDAAAGQSHSLVVLADGSLYAFGRNFFGALGLGDFRDRSTPERVEGLPGPVRSVAAGFDYSLVLLESGEVYSFGSGREGRLGHGDTRPRLTPEKVEGLPGAAVGIAAGASYALVLLENGDVYAFGNNFYGQLGVGDREDRHTPTRVVGLSGKAVAVAAGPAHSLVVLETSDVEEFGDQTLLFGSVSEIGVQYPVRIEGLSEVIAVAAGAEHTLVLVRPNSDGYAFGSGNWGQLGLGDFDDRHEPALIRMLPGAIADVAAGSDYSLVLLKNGDVYAFGNATHGRLGLGEEVATTPPRQVNLPRRITGLPGPARAISAGPAHALVLLTNGDVYAFGYNADGRLGLGDRANRYSPTKITGLTRKASAISAGRAHSLVLGIPLPFSPDQVYAFGEGEYLGLGDREDRLWPTRIEGLPDSIRQIVAGSDRSLVLGSGGEVYSFGHFLGPTAEGPRRMLSLVPRKMEGLPGRPHSIAAGIDYWLLVLENGDLYSIGTHWGFGDSGPPNRYILAKVPGLPAPVVEVDAARHVLVRLANGEVYSYGPSGALGHGDTDDRNLPTRIEGLSDVTAIAAGLNGSTASKGHSLAASSPDADDEAAVAAVKEALAIRFSKPGDHEEHVTGQIYLANDFYLPNLGWPRIRWHSSHPEVISPTGFSFEWVSPKRGASDVVVTLTAIIERGAASDTKTFRLVVKALTEDEIAVAADKAALQLAFVEPGDNTWRVTGPLRLADKGAHGSQITWESSDPAVVHPSGRVTRPFPGTGSARIDLIATITKGEASDQKRFTVSVWEAESGTVAEVPEEGGAVTADGVVVEFPAGTLPGAFRVHVAVERDPYRVAVPGGARLVSQVFTITKDRGGEFQRSVRITLAFDPAAVDRERDAISMVWFDEETGQWVELENVTVDWESGQVTGEINHFTRFAVLAVGRVSLTDIAGHWAEENIANLVRMRVVTGYPDNTFRPNNPITRAEFAAILVRALGLEAAAEKSFADTAEHWAREPIAIAYAHGIVRGYDEQTFGPDDLITREQMAVMAVSAAGLAPTGPPVSFADWDAVAPWAEQAVLAAVSHGVMGGYPDGTLRPKGNATRAEAVTVLLRILQASQE